MKMIKLLPLAFGLFIATSANANLMFQAGNIEDGTRWSISESSGIASYFADGKSGTVEFVCRLEGDPADKEDEHHCRGGKLKAELVPGKNFNPVENAPVTFLHQGMNGPFRWALTNEGASSGNIKIFYRCGKSVTIQCLGGRVVGVAK
jgi:hypothetical protein